MVRWIFLFVSFAVLIFASANIFSSTSPSHDWSFAAALTAIIWLAVYFIATTLSYRSIYLLTTTFVVPLCVFHLSWVFIHAFGVGEIGPFAFGMDRKFYALATWYTIFALACMGIGISIVTLVRPARAVHPKIYDIDVYRNFTAVYWTAIGLLLASGVFFLMFLVAVGNPFAYARTEFFQTGAAGRGLNAFLMVFPGTVVALVVTAQKPVQKIFAWSLAAIAAALLLFSGYRSPILFPMLVAGALLVKTGKKIPVWIPAVVCIAVIILVPAISQIRQIAYGDIDTEVVGEAIETTTVVDGFIELGGTLGVFSKTLTVVPDKAPFQWGKSYYVAVRDAIPNLGVVMRASRRAEGLKNQGFDDDALFDLDPADWMTFFIDPRAFRKGTGVGFSAVAEPYINFGFVGVLVYFVLLGASLAYLEGVDLRYHPWILLFSSTVMWALVKTVRNSSGNFIKPLVFTLIIIAIWRIIVYFLPVGNRVKPA